MPTPDDGRFAIQYGPKVWLALDADLAELQRVRRELQAVGLNPGGHFPNMNHNGRTFRFGMYLVRAMAEPVTRADEPRVRQAIVNALGLVLETAAPSPNSPSDTGAALPSHGDIARWRKAIEDALRHFPTEERDAHPVGFDPVRVANIVDRGDFRQAHRLIEAAASQGTSDEMLAPARVHLLVAQQRWQDALSVIDRRDLGRWDRTSRVQAAAVYFHSGCLNRALELLQEEARTSLTQPVDVDAADLYARALWAVGDRKEALTWLGRLVGSATPFADSVRRRRWQSLRDRWIGDVVELVERQDTTAEEKRQLIDASLAAASPEQHRALLARRDAHPSTVASHASEVLDRSRRCLAEGRYDDALGEIDRLSSEAESSASLEVDAMRAEALFRLGRHAEASAIDERLVRTGVEALSPRDQQRLIQRQVLSAAQRSPADVLAAVADVGARDSEALLAPEVARAVALARWDSGQPDMAQAEMLAALRRDPTDRVVAHRLWDGEREKLSGDDKLVILECLAQAAPRDGELAYARSEIFLDRGEYGRAHEAMCDYLEAMDGYQPNQQTCELATWAFDLASEAARKAQLQIDALAGEASRLVTVCSRARCYQPLLDNYLAKALELCQDNGAKLRLIAQLETATGPVRALVADECARVVKEESRSHFKVHFRDAALLLDSLSPERLKAVIADETQRAEARRPEWNLDLSGRTICLIGGTPTVRARALDYLARNYGLRKNQQREIEPFEGRFDTQVMRRAVFRTQANGLVPVDLVVHVPDCDSHTVYVALRQIETSAARRNLSMPICEAAGAGSTSIIRAVEAFFQQAE